MRIRRDSGPGSEGGVLRFFLEGGFVQVLKNRVGIVSASVESLDGLTRKAAEERLAALDASRPEALAPLEERRKHEDLVRVAKLRVRRARG